MSWTSHYTVWVKIFSTYHSPLFHFFKLILALSLACRILVAWSGIEPSLGSEHGWVLTTGPPRNSITVFKMPLCRTFCVCSLLDPWAGESIWDLKWAKEASNKACRIWSQEGCFYLSMPLASCSHQLHKFGHICILLLKKKARSRVWFDRPWVEIFRGR